MQLDLGYGIYDGEVNEAQLPHGFGVLRYASGGTYEGEWRDGVECGQGRSELPLSDPPVVVILTHEGAYENGTYHGHGVYTLKKDICTLTEEQREDESLASALSTPDIRYEGDFVNGAWCGHGILINETDGTRYEGDFANNRFSGKGILTDAQGNRYEGDFREHMFWGEGIYTWASGAMYVGAWQEDMRHGLGVYVNEQGERFEGIFENDVFTDK